MMGPFRCEFFLGGATDLLCGLDKKHEKRCSKRSKRMTFERRSGDVSDRERPEDGTVPQWCLT